MSEDVTYPPGYLAGVSLFNSQEFFDAHEAWEGLWVEAHGTERKFYQGLIQAAVALCHFCNGNRNGALKLLRTSGAYLEACPSPMMGMDVHGFRESMTHCLQPLIDNLAAEIDPERIPSIELDPSPTHWPDPAEFLREE